MCLMKILKATENQGFTLSSEDTFLGKPRGGDGVQIDHPLAFIGLKYKRNDTHKHRNSKTNESHIFFTCHKD